MNQILIIEDDPAIVIGLKALLKSENYDVTNSADGNEGLSEALRSKPDLILLDINLPSLNGFDICRMLRENKFFNPIIMLTSHSDQIDKVVGLEIGADDYITKPFENRELLARVRAQLRRYKKTDITSDNRVTPKEKYRRKLLSIMFTDIQDYSKVMNKNEDHELKILEIHNRMLTERIKNGKGKIIEITGDAFLVSFESALDAVNCAVEIQKLLKEYNKTKNNIDRIKIRIGIHLGDVTEFEGMLKGDVINIAARIQQKAKAGSVYISEAVYSAIKNKTSLKIKNTGKYYLKNIQEPMELFSISILN